MKSPTSHLPPPTSKTGFTLIELLVVVAIIGLLTSIVLAALNISRIRARDARRITDMKQIKLGFDLYLNEGGGYPPSSVWVPGQLVSCTSAFTRVPNDPAVPLYQYTYAATGTGIPSSCAGNPLVYPSYRIDFFIENKNAAYHLNEDGSAFDTSNQPVSWDSLLN